MSRVFRDSKFDVVLVAAPRAERWPSVGVQAISQLCADFGLETAWIGGADLKARGVIPLPGTGGIVLAEDAQGRVHRLQARAVVKFSPPSEMPEPFPGWYSSGLIPGATATKLMREAPLSWSPGVAVLGSGNRAFRFASQLLERGCPEVYAIETLAQWGGKRFAGWEVEKRRFETLGGKFLEAEPYKLSPRSALLWDFRVQDGKGIRVLEVSRVVSFGPFGHENPIREHPPGSLLFQFLQSSLATREEDSDGWMLEEERSLELASRLVRALTPDLGGKKHDLDFIVRKSRSRQKRILRHFEEPLSLSYQGKWTAGPTLREIRGFSGVPKIGLDERLVASIECIETIGCNLCEKACPENAIRLDRLRPTKEGEEPRSVISEKDCTACGICLQACPSATPVLVHEKPERSTARVSLPWRDPNQTWKSGEFATMVNRRGDPLGTARVVEITTVKSEQARDQVHLWGETIVHLEVPAHLLWEVRGIHKPKAYQSAVDQDFLAARELEKIEAPKRVEIYVNGEKRLVKDKITVTQALFETGQNRAEDMLYCADGSCGLCDLEVDGVKKAACQTTIRKGMSMKWEKPSTPAPEAWACHCLKFSQDELGQRVEQGKLNSCEAVFSTTHIGEGRCHGQLCCEPVRRRILEGRTAPVQGAAEWIDWRFPWSDWKIDPARLD